MRLIDMDKLEGSLHTTEMSENFGTVTSEEIGEWLEAQPIVAQWHKLIFRPLTEEEQADYDYQEWPCMVDGLPDFDKDVLVTDGKKVWLDCFYMADFIYLAYTDGSAYDVIAWMEIPPYKETQNDREKNNID